MNSQTKIVKYKLLTATAKTRQTVDRNMIVAVEILLLSNCTLYELVIGGGDNKEDTEQRHGAEEAGKGQTRGNSAGQAPQS